MKPAFRSRREFLGASALAAGAAVWMRKGVAAPSSDDPVIDVHQHTNYLDQTAMYPTGKVTEGGISDRRLADYPNMYGDFSAGSGQNALTRDEEHAKAFIARHQRKLFYGSDCADPTGVGDGCSGAGTLALLSRLCPSRMISA